MLSFTEHLPSAPHGKGIDTKLVRPELAQEPRIVVSRAFAPSSVTGDFMTLSWPWERGKPALGTWTVGQSLHIFPSTWYSLNIRSTLM